MLEDVELLLGDSASKFSDAFLNLIISQCKAEVEAYTNISSDNDSALTSVIEQLAVIRCNRINTEGLNSQSYSGISENYSNDYPANLLYIMNSKRRIKVM